MKRFLISLAMALLGFAGCATPQEGTVSGGDAPLATDIPPTNAAPSSGSRAYPDTAIQPNVEFPVKVESGVCPETVDIWEFLLGFEGGADHTVVVDWGAIAASPVEIVQSEEQRVVYEAPLTEEFATCVGTAHSEYFGMYAFEFAEGTVRFVVNLTTTDGFREIRYADVSVNRPYVYWRATE